MDYISHLKKNKDNQIILEDDNNWNQKLIDYRKSSRSLPWIDYNNPISNSQDNISKFYRPNIVTYRFMKDKETYFNPITQKYRDNEYNNQLNQIENSNIIDALAHNYDLNSNKQQTFNIINLEDRYKNFNDNTPKKFYTNILKKDNPQLPYNIISLKPLKEHHYNPPEYRPEVKYISVDDESNIKRENRINYHFRDYNIINNNYYADNDEKLEAEKEIQKLESAKKYIENSDYDIIKGVFINSNKEKEFNDRLMNRERIWRLTHSDHNKIPINPINNNLYDDEEQKIKDLKEANKKRRYKVRDELDNYYRCFNYSKDLEDERKRNNKANYFNYKVCDERGYDILNHNNIYYQYKAKMNGMNREFKQLKNDWELIQEGGNENETVTKIPPYKSPYEPTYTEVEERNYLKSRRQMLKSLPAIKENYTNRNNNTNNFRYSSCMTDANRYKNHKQDVSKSCNSNINLNNCLKKIDKNIWFSGKNNVSFEDKKEKIKSLNELNDIFH